MEQELFSVIILCYRHFEYLFAAIDSVLEQDYPEIELIVSDDGSQNFPHDQIGQYIEMKKRENIKRVYVHQEEKNVGTVKHLNHAIPLCQGAYIIALAGDDALGSKEVLSRYVNGFATGPENCLIQMAQTAMYDETLEDVESYYVGPIVQAAIEKTRESTNELLNLLLTRGACLPSTSTCFKKDFFPQFGAFDEGYALVEDYPMHMRLAEEGWVIHYNNFVAIKHRHGGISHGQKGALSESSRLYFSDTRKMIQELVLTRLSRLPETERKAVALHWNRQLRWLDFNLAQASGNKTEAISAGLKYPGYACLVALGKMWVWAYRWHLKPLLCFLALRILTPAVIEMAEDVFGLTATLLTLILSGISALLLAVWVAAFVIWCANKLIWMIQRFPKEILAIG